MNKCICKPLFKSERKSTLNGLIIFSLVVAVFSFITIALYPVLKDVLSQMAEEAVGTNFEDMFKMESITEFFTTNMFQIWGLFGIIYACVLAVKLTSGNFKDGSFEMIYSLNISRKTVVKTKLLTLFINLTVFNLIVGVVTYIGMGVFAGFSGFSNLNYLLYFALTWVVTLQVGLLSFALGLISKRKFNTFAGVMLALVFYFVITVAEVVMKTWVGYLSPLTPLTENVISSGFGALSTSWVSLVVWTVVPAVLMFISVQKFKNDDLC